MHDGIQNREFSTAALAATSTATKFFVVTMTLECLKLRTQFRWRSIDAWFLLKVFRDK